MKLPPLWRYNARILFGTGYWILVLPVAASQIVTLWMMALAADFSEMTGQRIAEMMTPILGAFLVAHSMAPEYKSGIGSVLASKPVSLHRVVTIRIALAMLLAFLLTFVTLVVCSVGLQPLDLGPVLLAAIPSLWFLAVVALVSATLLRSSMAGFAMAAALWGLDLLVGYGVHPFLSLQGRHATLDTHPLSGLWLWGKLALTVIGLLLLLWHSRILPRVCRPPERKDVVKVVSGMAAVVLAYALTGALTTVGFGYINRGNLPYKDVDWFRRQMTTYGPIPVAQFFGPAFSTLVAPTPPSAGELSGLEMRFALLERARDRWPNSIWADAIAFSLAKEREDLQPAKAVKDYQLVADRFGNGPYASKALVSIVRMDKPEVTLGERVRAARVLVSDWPTKRDTERAAAFLQEQPIESVNTADKLTAAEVAVKVAPVHREPEWWLTCAELQLKLGQTDGARASAQKAMSSAQTLNQRATDPKVRKEIAVYRPRIDGAARRAHDILQGLGG